MPTESENEDKAPISIAELDQPAIARMAKQQAEARHQLELAIIEFLEKMNAGGHEQLGRNPSSKDLLPFFAGYAMCLFDAEIQERLPQLTTIEYGRKAFTKVANQVVHSICRKRGTWRSVVRHAWAAVGSPIVIMTRFGAYTEGAFIRPRRSQMRVRLQLHAHQWEAKWYERKIEADQVTHSKGAKRVSDTNSTKRKYPDRAKWLEERLAERCWSHETFHKKGGPDRKTTQRILRGEPVRPQTLQNVAKGLSNYRFNPNTEFKQIEVKDIPNS